MIRLVPIVALLVVSLCASATSASAECAWVLWWTGSNVGTTWGILSAYPNLAACDQALKTDMSSLKRAGYEVHGAPEVGHGFDAAKGDEKKLYQCLPDTLDPRGPKK